MRKYFICSVGENGSDYEEENLKRCLTYKGHFMHQNTTQKGVFADVQEGSVIFLKYKDQLIAYGEVISSKVDTDKRLGDWNHATYIKEWFFFDIHNPAKGVNNYGIQRNTLPGSGQMGTVKGVTVNYGLMKAEEINNQNDLYLRLKTEAMMQNIFNLIQANKNLILTGAPGTGKTHQAFELAMQLTGASSRKDSHIAFVQFHPSYDYSDFVEGIKPELVGGSVTLAVHDGIFKAFCRRAETDASNRYVFIIDEINRADLSRVFGELFFGLEPSYRGVPITTQYAYLQEKQATERGEPFQPFSIPDNVYIIGTMNDIDRSVESMDFALRRRFAWQEISAESSERIIDSAGLPEALAAEAKVRMRSLNTAIVLELKSSSYQIGGAYFHKLKHYVTSDVPFGNLWDNHLKVVISEYVRGMPQGEEKLDRMHAAYDRVD